MIVSRSPVGVLLPAVIYPSNLGAKSSRERYPLRRTIAHQPNLAAGNKPAKQKESIMNAKKLVVLAMLVILAIVVFSPISAETPKHGTANTVITYKDLRVIDFAYFPYDVNHITDGFNPWSTCTMLNNCTR